VWWFVWNLQFLPFSALCRRVFILNLAQQNISLVKISSLLPFIGNADCPYLALVIFFPELPFGENKPIETMPFNAFLNDTALLISQQGTRTKKIQRKL